MSLYRTYIRGSGPSRGGIRGNAAFINSSLRRDSTVSDFEVGRDRRYERHQGDQAELRGSNSLANNPYVGSDVKPPPNGLTTLDKIANLTDYIFQAIGIDTPINDQNELAAAMKNVNAGIVYNQIQGQLSPGQEVLLVACENSYGVTEWSVFDLNSPVMFSPQSCQSWVVRPDIYSACSPYQTTQFSILGPNVNDDSKIIIDLNNSPSQQPASSKTETSRPDYKAPVQMPGEAPPSIGGYSSRADHNFQTGGTIVDDASLPQRQEGGSRWLPDGNRIPIRVA